MSRTTYNPKDCRISIGGTEIQGLKDPNRAWAGSGSPIHDHELGFHAEDMTTFEFNLTIRGRSIMKKNSNTVRKFGERASIGPSTKYKNWEKQAAQEIADQWGRVFSEPLPKGTPVLIRVLTYLPNRMGWPDLAATYEGPQDVLECHRKACKPKCAKHGGVYFNDKDVFGHPGSVRLVDKENPRVELRITPFLGMTL